MPKPRVKAANVELSCWNGMQYIAYLYRLSHHPKLGAPAGFAESKTRTSLILRIDFEKKELETLNTVYWWE